MGNSWRRCLLCLRVIALRPVSVWLRLPRAARSVFCLWGRAFFRSVCFWGAISYLHRSCQKATALAAATFSESTPWYMGMRTV